MEVYKPNNLFVKSSFKNTKTNLIRDDKIIFEDLSPRITHYRPF